MACGYLCLCVLTTECLLHPVGALRRPTVGTLTYLDPALFSPHYLCTLSVQHLGLPGHARLQAQPAGRLHQPSHEGGEDQPVQQAAVPAVHLLPLHQVRWLCLV